MFLSFFSEWDNCDLRQESGGSRFFRAQFVIRQGCSLQREAYCEKVLAAFTFLLSFCLFRDNCDLRQGCSLHLGVSKNRGPPNVFWFSIWLSLKKPQIEHLQKATLSATFPSNRVGISNLGDEPIRKGLPREGCFAIGRQVLAVAVFVWALWETKQTH